MLSDLEIRVAENSDIEDILKFYNVNFHDNRELKHWSWEYRELLPGSEVFVVVRDRSKNNELVGIQGMIPLFLNINGDKCLTGKSETALLHENYRKGGVLFRKYNEYAISRCKEKSMVCVWGMNEIGSVWKGFLGFTTTTDEMQDSILVLNILKTLKNNGQTGDTRSSVETNAIKKNMRDKIAFYWRLLKGNICFRLRRIPIQTRDEGYTITDEIKNSEDISLLYCTLRRRHPNLIYIHQDDNYQNWRIKKNPFVKYLTLYLYQGRSLKAYCYISIAASNTAFLTDITFENTGAGCYLLNHALKELRKKGISYVQFFGNISNPLIKEVFNLLVEFGFYVRKSKMNFLIRNISALNERELLNVRNWYINGLWSEGITV